MGVRVGCADTMVAFPDFHGTTSATGAQCPDRAARRLYGNVLYQLPDQRGFIEPLSRLVLVIAGREQPAHRRARAPDARCRWLRPRLRRSCPAKTESRGILLHAATPTSWQ